jgi:hypothetical protein
MGYETTFNQEPCGCVVATREHDFFSLSKEKYYESLCPTHKDEKKKQKIQEEKYNNEFKILCDQEEKKLLQQAYRIGELAKSHITNDIVGKTIKSVRHEVDKVFEVIKDNTFHTEVVWNNRGCKCIIHISSLVEHHYNQRKINIRYHVATIQRDTKLYKLHFIQNEPELTRW